MNEFAFNQASDKSNQSQFLKAAMGPLQFVLLIGTATPVRRILSLLNPHYRKAPTCSYRLRSCMQPYWLSPMGMAAA